MIVYTDKHRIPFQIDEQDYEAVCRYSWCIGGAGYPQTHIGKGATLRTIRLHMFLLGPAPDGMEWDHEKRDRLDNRRSKLRAVTRQINRRNTGPRPSNTTGVTGVKRIKGIRDRWRASIKIAGREKHLGYFQSVEEAAAARHAAEQEMWQAG